MIRSKIILLDVDDVLLDWFEGFNRYMHHQGYAFTGKRTWTMDNNFGLSKCETFEHIKRFNNGHWEFGTLNPIKGAKEAVAILVETGHTLVAITSCSTNPVAVALRKSNLHWCFGDVFQAVHCVDLREPKDTHLADYEPTFWVEDKMSNAISGLKYGHTSILLQTEYNFDEEYPGVRKVADWSEALEIMVQTY